MANWPPDLRGPLAEGWSRTEPDGVRRTRMDAGPDKMRRDSTAVRAKETLPFKWTLAELEEAQAFYAENKALSFTYPHPLWGEVTAWFDGPFSVSVRRPWYMVSVRVEIGPA